MSTQKAKFELFARLQKLGFTYEESAALRRIEMTLSRWAEAECNGEIQRHEETNKPYRHNAYSGSSDQGYPIADREAGAWKRAVAIVAARNAREGSSLVQLQKGRTFVSKYEVKEARRQHGSDIIPYHQSDPRGCSLYLVKKSDIPAWTDEQIVKHSGPSAVATPERRQATMLSMYYTRGLAVCA